MNYCECAKEALADQIGELVEFTGKQVTGVITPMLDQIYDPEHRKIFLASLLATLVVTSHTAVCDSDEEADLFEEQLYQVLEGARYLQ